MRLHATINRKTVQCFAAAFLLMFCCCSIVRADDSLTITKVQLSRRTGRLFVTFGQPYPSPDALSVNTNWQVVLFPTGQAAPVTLTVTASTAEEPYVNTHRALLTLNSPIPAAFKRVAVTFLPMNAPEGSLRPSDPAGPIVESANGKDDADIYVSGSVSHAGNQYTYSTDTSVKYNIKAFGQDNTDLLSVQGQIAADSDELGDPDSASARLTLLSGVSHPETVFHYAGLETRGYRKKWDVFGVELDKNTNVVNLFTAPSLTMALNHGFYKKLSGAAAGAPEKLVANVSLVLHAGVEAGWNARNEVSVSNGPAKGTGGILRGVPEATFTFSIPAGLTLNRVVFTSDYTARILARDELFQETRHVSTPVPELRAGTRHYINNSINFMFNDYAGITLGYEYGSLPPTFKFLNHRVTLGVLLQLKQDRTP